ncbi:Zinc finger protein [Tetrabaena socialis]|uniref:Zinc finger protein n=1 Tax=Tetrabaena socialis TaxID=47790 RepID=A0A2J7ZQ62_9CHLO|nr:Zinc finger protein [Tetrabaena socialis]|eukprot:PNH02410.1 Zinc finger protein [Tetrabaena socialis]
MHTGEKPYACDHEGCGATFALSGDLTTHKRTHTGDKPYACDHPGCKASFTQSGHLKNHKRTHTGEKPYTCDHEGCGATFALSGNLTNHKRTHTGEKPYACDHEGCGATFAMRGALTTHERAHTGEKPYACDYEGCGAAFAMRSNLKNHKRTHTGEKPYACDNEGCGAAFTQSNHLTIHKRSWHTQEGQARQKKQEQRVSRALDKAGIPYKREHQIDFRCVGDDAGFMARVDFVILLHGRVIFLEVDEGQHKFGSYGSASCDMKRMSRILESLAQGGNTLPLVFLRYNPNVFRVDGKVVKKLKVTRESELVSLLENPASDVFLCDRPLVIQYMYYDVAGCHAVVTRDPEYNVHIAQCCARSIV